jgi:hypothetical protein
MRGRKPVLLSFGDHAKQRVFEKDLFPEIRQMPTLCSSRERLRLGHVTVFSQNAQRQTVKEPARIAQTQMKGMIREGTNLTM